MKNPFEQFKKIIKGPPKQSREQMEDTVIRAHNFDYLSGKMLYDLLELHKGRFGQFPMYLYVDGTNGKIALSDQITEDHLPIILHVAVAQDRKKPEELRTYISGEEGTDKLSERALKNLTAAINDFNMKYFHKDINKK